MAKRKSKCKVRGAHIVGSAASNKERVNPFEVRINKRRYEILGRKTKNERGKPGVSRSRGLKKREKTLLVEYKQRNKVNSFIDKRFGEYDEDLSLEEKMLKRFATEKQKHHEKAWLFNLEDEDLTHFGQSLGDIKQYNNPALTDEESDNEDFDDNNENHFGGFLKRKGPNERKSVDQPRSKKEIMEEVVANAKLKKHERQVVKEEAETMRQKLDEDLDSIRNLLSFRGDGTDKEPRHKADDYDKTVREMTFEVKAQASEKLKTGEQLARQEEERLRILEAERIRRMKGLPRQEKKPTHISADDLGDSFTLDVDRRSLLTYEDGKMVMPDGYISDVGSEDIDVGREGSKVNEEVDESEEEEEDESEEVEENESDDSDLELSGNESSDNVDVNEKRPTATEKLTKDFVTNNDSVCTKSSKPSSNELPYTFNAPKTYEEFHELIDKRPSSDQLKIIERIQKCNHPKLNPSNKSRMEVFFEILVKYVDELASRSPPELTLVDGLVCHLFELAQHSPLHVAKHMQETLINFQKEFCATSKKRKIPSLKMVLHLRIVSLLFPCSDFRHGVCTPALIFMGQILSQITVHTAQDALIGLFICSLIYEFVHTSKRYVPEVINYLIGILYLSSEKTEPLGKVFPPFKLNSKHRDILKISSAVKPSDDAKPLSIGKIFSKCEQEETDESTRTSALMSCLRLLKKFISLYVELVSFPEIFQPVVHHLKRIKISKYPTQVQALYTDILTTTTSDVPERQPLTLQTRRPTPIQMFEPKFEEHYEVKRKRNTGTKALNERQKLRYKHKKEFKGALREIRKDSQFLAQQKLREQLERDAERARKTKEIQNLLSNQQAEANAFNRKKRKSRE